ncbi:MULTISPECIES: DUF1707 domain-containing protein [Corynebacterium]|uniref:DUF1707 SHOCT-like domain-containing protein n=1 Tax=Corynebacterium TaxID=1716 RepID=UPI001F468448|nr:MULTISPECIES: DUF1707 domain-containing protein [Corynebacterium]
MTHPHNLRLSDAERTEAMSALGKAFGEGRLSLDEYDTRCKAVAAANYHADLTPLFQDIPQRPNFSPSAATGTGSTIWSQATTGAAGNELQVYTAPEIMAARRAGQRKRAGAFWLGTIGAIGAMGIGAGINAPVLSGLAMLLIPTLFVLLYIMKIGPDDWYMPTLNQLERNRREVAKAKALELEASHAYEQAQRKLERKAQIDRLTNDALGMAQDTLDRFKPKGN